MFGSYDPEIGRFSANENIQYKYPLVGEDTDKLKVFDVRKVNDYDDESEIVIESARTIDTVTRTILQESLSSLDDILQSMSEHLTNHEKSLLEKIRTQLQSAQSLDGETSSSLTHCFESVEKLIRVYGKTDSLIQKKKIIESFGEVNSEFELGTFFVFSLYFVLLTHLCEHTQVMWLYQKKTTAVVWLLDSM